MKLHRLYKKNNIDVLKEYLDRLRIEISKSNKRLLSEGKKIIVTTEIIDDEDTPSTPKSVETVELPKTPEVDQIPINIDDSIPGLSLEAKNEFIQRAKEIGKYDDPVWVNQLLNGLKQAGVQGFNEITEDERPVSNKELRHLVGLLVRLIDSR